MTEIELDGQKVHLFIWDYIDSNTYVMIEGKSALVVDPVDIKEFWYFINIRGINRADVVLTHEHFDHINGLNELRQKVECTVYAHVKCSENIGITTRNLSSAANVLEQVSEKVQKRERPFIAFVCTPADVVFDEAYKFYWNGHKVELVYTPGHSAGSVCMVLDENKLFTGDTLLAVPAITRLPGGNKRIFQEVTLPWLQKRMDTIKWFLPGHGDSWKREDKKLLLGNELNMVE